MAVISIRTTYGMMLCVLITSCTAFSPPISCLNEGKILCFHPETAHSRRPTIACRGVTLPHSTTKEKVAPTPIGEEAVPKLLSEALRTFFLDHHHPGPPLVVISLLVVTAWRISLPSSLDFLDVATLCGTVCFWWIQEHFMHQRLLHSVGNWYGKNIHQEHHDRPYYHISIDPAPLMIGWLLAAHTLLRWWLPLPLALSATLGYAGAGLFYEWTHFIVHTRVRFPSRSYFGRLKSHHTRHHLISSNYWLGFSVPAIDTLMGTNPEVKHVRKMQKHGGAVNR